MKKTLSILLVIIALFSSWHLPWVNASTNAWNSGQNTDIVNSINYTNEKNVSFTLYSGDRLVEHIYTTGTKVKVEYYGCTQGSVYVTVYDYGVCISSFTIPYRGGSTVYYTFDCLSGRTLDFSIVNSTGNPARGSFKIYY